MYKLLKIKVKHLLNAKYLNVSSCPIAIAAKEKFKVKYANEGVTTLFLRKNSVQDKTIYYSHKEYLHEDFLVDLKLAKKSKDLEKVIRTIKLKL